MTPILIDRNLRGARVDGVFVGLTPREYAVLTTLADNDGRVLGVSELSRAAGGDERALFVSP